MTIVKVDKPTGVVHAWVGQIVLKCNVFKSIFVRPTDTLAPKKLPFLDFFRAVATRVHHELRSLRPTSLWRAGEGHAQRLLESVQV